MELIIVLLVFCLLDVAALCWGSASGEDWNSLEWERRQSWRAFHYVGYRRFADLDGVETAHTVIPVRAIQLFH